MIGTSIIGTYMKNCTYLTRFYRDVFSEIFNKMIPQQRIEQKLPEAGKVRRRRWETEDCTQVQGYSWIGGTTFNNFYSREQQLQLIVLNYIFEIVGRILNVLNIFKCKHLLFHPIMNIIHCISIQRYLSEFHKHVQLLYVKKKKDTSGLDYNF